MSKNTSCVAVIGGGSWATAIVKILSENSHLKINWWIRNNSHVEHINKFRHNPGYLSDVEIDVAKVRASSSLEETIKEAEVVIIAIPAAFIKEVLSGLDTSVFQSKNLVSAVKGMIPGENLLISQYLETYFAVPDNLICMISGPCHSEEVALERQSYLTIAGRSEKEADRVAKLLTCRYIKTSVSLDLYGVEYAAVMKNVYGIACGIARGLNYGDNFQAVLVSNALVEMEYALSVFYPTERNVARSAYNGDLLVTTYSQFSRNRTLGNMLGRGYSVKTALVEMNMIAEGYYGVKCIYELAAKFNIELPIIRAVYNIIYERIAPSVEYNILENRLS